jgi:hypothetical protein
MASRYGRLLHDFQWMSFKSRTVSPGWGGLPSTPETVPLWVTAHAGKDDIKLSKQWVAYIDALNNDRSFKFIMSPPAGWFNRNDNADTLSFGGNVVEITSINKGVGQIKNLLVKNGPPDADKYNFKLHPEIVHKFTAITKNGDVINPAEGIDVYTFAIGRSFLFVPLTRVELFPALPLQVTINATTKLDARELPDENSKVLAKVNPAKNLEIYEYAPRGTHVWGRSNKGWVTLQWYPTKGKLSYPTSWKMKTIPPVPPVK